MHTQQTNATKTWSEQVLLEVITLVPEHHDKKLYIQYKEKEKNVVASQSGKRTCAFEKKKKKK